MKTLAPFVLSLALAAAIPAYSSSSPQPPSEEQLRRMAERVVESSVRIINQLEDGQTGFCTGMVINAGGHVLTAAHCVPADNAVWIDGEPVHVLKKGEWLALLDSTPGKRPPLSIAKENPKILEKVYAVGNGFDWGMIVLERIVAGFYPNRAGDHTDLAINAPLAPGMSGGPIVNAKGELVAINQMATVATGIGCDQKAIREFLK